MMAGTYVPIQSVTLASSAASVTFSAIPQTFTDLVVRVTTRNTAALAGRQINIAINASSTNYSFTNLQGDGANAASFRGTDTFIGYTDGATATANTFGSHEIYFPNYTGSTNKPFSATGCYENNSTTAVVTASANLWSNTAAITSLQISVSSFDMVAGSTFHLYGIKNS